MKAWRSATVMTWLVLAIRLGGFSILLPLALANLSDAEISVWLLFFAIASLQVILDFGFSPTFSREIAYGFAGHSLTVRTRAGPPSNRGEDRNGEADWSIISSAVSTMTWLYRRIAVAAFLLMTTLGTWAAWNPIERISQPTHAWLAWAAVVPATAISTFGTPYASFLIGANRIALQKRWEASVTAASLAAQGVAILAGFGLLGLVLAAQAGVLLQVLVNWILARHVAAGRVVRRADHDISRKLLIQAMWPATWRTAVGAVMSLGLSQGMAVAAANMLAAAEAAGVQVALRIMQVISQVSQAPFYTRIPEFNRAQAASAPTHLTGNAGIAMRTSLWIFVAGALVADLVVPRIFVLIGSQTHFPDEPFWLFLTFAVFFERFGGMHVQLVLTTNRAISHLTNGVAAAAWVSAFVLLFPLYGALALPISMLIAYAGFFAVLSAFFSHSAHPRNFWAFERNTSLAPFCMILVYALVHGLSAN
ncbi:hypothetical protein ACFONC_01905 [Luteimonas soli]|uniref:Polysaccharide biosynthesis protein n=1 Tax=Luteimonas soli TaxID=1648966 RepID=A0ABV7XFH8_9GAMM